MSGIKVIHTGDIHIGMKFENASFSGEFSKKRRYEIKNTFMNIVDRAITSKADLLLISGDMLEAEHITLGELKEISNKFKQAEKTKIIMIAGNHDPLLKTSLYHTVEWAKNVYMMNTSMDKIDIEDLNTVVYGLSWDRKKIKEELLNTILVEDRDKINILLAHGDIYQKSEYLPIDKNNLIAKKFDYVALGHIHKHNFIEGNIAYSGSPEPLDFSETGEHGIIEGTISKDNLNLQFVPMAKRKFYQLTLNVNEDMVLEDIVQAIKENVEAAGTYSDMYRIVLKGLRDRDIVIDTEYLTHALEETAYVEIKDQTIANYNLDALKKDYSDSIIGKYIEYMEDQGLNNEIVKDALYEGLHILLSEKVN